MILKEKMMLRRPTYNSLSDSWLHAEENATLAAILLPYFQLQLPNSAQEISNTIVLIKFPKTFSEQILSTKY